MNEILRFDRVHSQKENTVILNDFSLNIKKGEILTVLGRSGSGKSTLLRLAIGLDELTGGSIQFHNRNIHEWNISELRRKMGLVLQLPFLFPGTVEENLLYGPTIHQMAERNDPRMVQRILEKTGLPNDLAKRPANALSVGQQMRVSLGRTLANQPEILLLDEPTASLDAQSEEHILGLIRDLNQKDGYTIVCVTHSIEAARILQGRAILLEEGRVFQEGPVDEILQQSHSITVNSLLRRSPS